jgi:hypothetical protein
VTTSLVLESNTESEQEDRISNTGRLVVPPGYERYLKKPIEALIVGVGRTRVKRDYTVEGPNTTSTYARASLTYVTVNAGTSHGVRNHMRFRFKESEVGDFIKIIRARKYYSTGVIIRSLDEDESEISFDSNPGRSKTFVASKLTTSLF